MCALLMNDGNRLSERKNELKISFENVRRNLYKREEVCYVNVNIVLCYVQIYYGYYIVIGANGTTRCHW